MSWKKCWKTILKTASIAVFAVLFYTACDDNGVKVITPEVRTFTDNRDGKTYKEVTIGEQRWMAENLRYEAEGSVCSNDLNYFGLMDSSHLAQRCEEYGRLYNWTTVMNGASSTNAVPSGVEGVCPAGWHVPSDAEWTELTDFIGLNAGTKLKSRDWHDIDQPGTRPTVDGTNKYRFTALPGGHGSFADGKFDFYGMSHNGNWWSSTELWNDSTVAYIRTIYGTQTYVGRGTTNKARYFLSVRCVGD